MKLSLAAVRICEQKYGKGSLCGFEHADSVTLKNLSAEAAQQAFDELAESEWIELHEDGVRISALGQHNLNMMIDPDVFVALDNTVQNIRMKIYIKNAYYLMVLEENRTQAGDGSDEMTIELLLSLRDVVSSFVYSVYREEEYEPLRDREGDYPYDIQVTARAWNRKDETASELVMCADYGCDGQLDRVTGRIEAGELPADGSQCEQSDFINHLTMWVFARLAETMENEVVVRREN